MSLLCTRDQLAERMTVAAGPLGSLARSLATDLEPLLGRPPFIPADKALLSRDGGRCPRDGSLLEFDPFNARDHRCAVCGQRFGGAFHGGFWIYWYQLWLAERAVHAALLGALGMGQRYRALSEHILAGYASRYESYPNRDNVLGPSRPFFSTYLESVWLLQLCIAVDLLELGCEREGMTKRDPTVSTLVRDRVIEPSCALIRGYDEGQSNRQVWNNAALLAAGVLLDRPALAEQAVFGSSGLLSHLRYGLLPDGTWYEGENYHLFAHRGLWYGVASASLAGFEVPAELTRRFEEGFATPFVSALPDLTLPSRRDSQYAITLRQWRFAELCELGLARRDDSRLTGALYRLYTDPVERRAIGRAESSADVERNVPASALSRADLGWRSLLFARPELPPLAPTAPSSALLEAQGFAILRRAEGEIYVALDYGHSGGGHGHPDRLNVLLSDGATRWLDDMGTGSYVDRSLHWYRSTLAHNAPLVDGASQLRVHGALVAFEERGGAGWVSARAAIAKGVTVERTLVVMSDYFIDDLVWNALKPVAFDLPLHADLMIENRGIHPMPGGLRGQTGLEDGFDFVGESTVAAVPKGARVELSTPCSAAGIKLRAWSLCDRDTEWWRAIAPGPPGRGAQPFSVVRARGKGGRLTFVWSWREALTAVHFDADTIICGLTDGTFQVHRRGSAGWQIDLQAGAARSTIALGGIVSPASATCGEGALVEDTPPAQRLGMAAATVFNLGAGHYRRSEESWEDAGRPRAKVRLERSSRELSVTVTVPQSERNFALAGAENVYDNEPADIAGDGVQLYLSSDQGTSAWILVPEPYGTAVRVRPIPGWDHPRDVTASWRPTKNGYELRVSIRVEDVVGERADIGLDVVVNEMPRDRRRRRGQLVLSGGSGEFVYLRGDRHDRTRLLRFRLANG